MGVFARLRNTIQAINTTEYSFISYDDGNGGMTTIDLSNEDLDAIYSNAFRGCLLAKARPLSTLPVRVYKREGGVRVEPSEKFAATYAELLRHKWNPFLSGADGIKWLEMKKDVVGEAFARVQFDGAGVPVAIWPMSSTPTVEMTANGTAVFRYGGDKFTPAGTYLDNEIIWVKSPILDKDGIHGRSLAELAANEIGLSINLTEFYGRMLNGEGNFPGWLETDQQLTEQDVKRISTQLSDGGGVVNAGKIRLFDRGLTYKTTSQSMVDLNLVEQEKWVLQEVCRTLSVPPQEVYELSNSTYSNYEQGALNFATKTLTPEAVTIETALSSILWGAGLSDCYVQLDMNGLLRGSNSERMESYRIGIYAGIYSPNDVRAKEDMPPYEGGDEYFRATAYSTVDPESGEVTPAATAHNNGRPMPGGSGESERDNGEGVRRDKTSAAALAVVHNDMCRRVRERYDAKGDSEQFRRFASNVLAPMAEACATDGIAYSIDEDIERIING